MNLEFGSFGATDNIVLPGLLYTPDKPTRKVVVWLHGMNTGIFYNSTWMNALGQALIGKGIALFAFNNRGADDSRRLRIAGDAPSEEEDNRYQAGTFYEKIADCVADIDGAVAWLREKGFDEFYLAGHSTGANKICVYDDLAQHSPFTKYVLAGPGDDVGQAFHDMGNKRFWAALKQAAKLVTGGDPLKVMPRYSGMYPFSAQSAWDILNPDGGYNTFPYYEAKTERIGSKPLFKEYRSITKPSLVIIGELDQFMYTAGGSQGALDILMAQTANAMLKHNDFMLVPFADHSFHDAEIDFAQKVAEWLA